MTTPTRSKLLALHEAGMKAEAAMNDKTADYQTTFDAVNTRNILTKNLASTGIFKELDRLIEVLKKTMPFCGCGGKGCLLCEIEEALAAVERCLVKGDEE